MSLLTFLLLLIPLEILSYPIYGTKRYGRTPISWGSPIQVPSYYYVPRTRYPMNYYDAMSPFLQEYSDEYYLPQEYPIYYPQVPQVQKSPGPKYDFYQAMPYYFEDRHMERDGYGGYMDPEELQEQLQHEEDRLEREESLPVGQETWYTNDNTQPDSIDDINAAFLQNLMLYNDALSPKDTYYPNLKDPYPEDILSYTEEPKMEDLDVKELKMLAERTLEKPKKQRKNKNKNKGKKEKVPKEPNSSDSWMDYPPKRNTLYNSLQPLQTFPESQIFSTRKQTLPKTLTSTPQPSTTSNQLPELSRRGQKEFVLLRPATPVRKPFSKPVMDLLNQQGNSAERKRDPNVYETIKHLLEMEKSLEKDYPGEDIKSPMKKRYVSTEENLVDQLSTLKKTA